ncbi:MAG TPA: hypothetical protein VI756_11915, partial [Blastocatellia bacterium]
YLQLNSQEQAEFDTRVKALGPGETEGVMEIVTSWMREGIKQGRKEGLEEGQLRATQAHIVEILVARFGRVPAAAKKKIKTIDSIPRLKALLREAATTESLSQFQRGMDPHEQRNDKTHRSK